VYQAYSPDIAQKALETGKFVSPPFKMERMTWIKPSFLWMMYRSGWASKPGQEYVLSIDIARDGFEWALKNSVLSRHDPQIYDSYEEWQSLTKTAPVRIQWDPERNIYLKKLSHRSIQIGLREEAVRRYTEDWIVHIRDITKECKKVKKLLDEGRIDDALSSLPKERPYHIKTNLQHRVGLK
jgi:hypothetical protein